MSIQLPFTHVILDDLGEPLRQVRWSNREYKWFKDAHPSIKVITLDKPKIIEVKINLETLVGEALF